MFYIYQETNKEKYCTVLRFEVEESCMSHIIFDFLFPILWCALIPAIIVALAIHHLYPIPLLIMGLICIFKVLESFWKTKAFNKLKEKSEQDSGQIALKQRFNEETIWLRARYEELYLKPYGEMTIKDQDEYAEIKRLLWNR